MASWPLVSKSLTVLAVVLLAACGSSDTKEQGPSPLVDFDEEKSFDTVWRASVGDGQGDFYNRLTVSINDGNIYAASAEGEVAAFTLASGDDVWDVDVGHELVGGVGVGGGLVLIATLTGEVIALDQQTGESKWTAVIGAEVLAPPQADDERVYLQTFDGTLVALNAQSGEREWSFKSSLPVLTLRGTSTPLLYRDTVIAAFANGRVYGFEASSGAVLWESRIAAPQGSTEIERIVDIDGELLLDNNLLYAASYQGNVAALTPDSGRQRWQHPASSYVSVATGFGNVYVVSDKGVVTAHAKTGEGVRWQQDALKGRKLTAPVTLGSYVIVGDFEGYLHALSQVDGHFVARVKVDSDGLRSRMLVENKTLYVYSNGGRLAAYQLEDD